MLTKPTLFIIKSREMMTSWLVCAYVAWICQWYPHMLWVMQTDKEAKVIELVNYCRILWRHQPEWMQKRVVSVFVWTIHLFIRMTLRYNLRKVRAQALFQQTYR